MGILNTLQKRLGPKKNSIPAKTKPNASSRVQERKFSQVGASASSKERTSTTDTIERKDERGSAATYQVLFAPVVTEKSAHLASERKYVFRVPVGVVKGDVRRAIFGQYGVNPTKIARIQKRGQQVRYGKVRGVTKRWVKMIVTLPKGKTLDVYGT